MTSVSRIVQGSLLPATVTEPAVEAAAPASTALVPVRRVTPIEDIAAVSLSPRRGASATFVAQLIATEQQLPQTRERRRAAPREALAAYGAMARLGKRK